MFGQLGPDLVDGEGPGKGERGGRGEGRRTKLHKVRMPDTALSSSSAALASVTQ